MIQINKTYWRVTMAFLVMVLVATVYVLAVQDSKRQILVSETGCCSIEIYQGTDYTYLVTWTDNTTIDGFTYTELVEIEYPDDDMTPEEQLKYELEWTVSEFKDLCWTHHY